jgi:DNA-binding transcriptional LysR family regulator
MLPIRMSDLVSSGSDVGVTIGQLHDTALIARRIAETDSHLFASPDYLARRGVPRVPEDLAAHDCLTLAAATGMTTWVFSRGRTRHDVAIRAPVAVNDPDALVNCACAGLGVLMIADWLARPLVGAGRLVRVLCDYNVEPRGTPINVLYQSRSYVPQKVRAFIEFYSEKALEQFGPIQDTQASGR